MVSSLDEELPEVLLVRDYPYSDGECNKDKEFDCIGYKTQVASCKPVCILSPAMILFWLPLKTLYGEANKVQSVFWYICNEDLQTKVTRNWVQGLLYIEWTMCVEELIALIN